MGDSKGLVLVVEDERAIADLVRLYLAREGFGVHVEADGAAGLAAARRLHPVAIVLDVGLPGLDGTELCRRLRADGDWTPVLFVTARDDEVDRVLGPGARRRRLRDQAVLAARAGRPGQDRAAPRPRRRAVQPAAAGRPGLARPGPPPRVRRRRPRSRSPPPSSTCSPSCSAGPAGCTSGSTCCPRSGGTRPRPAPARSTCTSPSCGPSSATPARSVPSAASATRRSPRVTADRRDGEHAGDAGSPWSRPRSRWSPCWSPGWCRCGLVNRAGDADARRTLSALADAAAEGAGGTGRLGEGPVAGRQRTRNQLNALKIDFTFLTRTGATSGGPADGLASRALTEAERQAVVAGRSMSLTRDVGGVRTLVEAPAGHRRRRRAGPGGLGRRRSPGTRSSRIALVAAGRPRGGGAGRGAAGPAAGPPAAAGRADRAPARRRRAGTSGCRRRARPRSPRSPTR